MRYHRCYFVADIDFGDGLFVKYFFSNYSFAPILSVLNAILQLETGLPSLFQRTATTRKKVLFWVGSITTSSWVVLVLASNNKLTPPQFNVFLKSMMYSCTRMMTPGHGFLFPDTLSNSTRKEIRGKHRCRNASKNK